MMSYGRPGCTFLPGLFISPPFSLGKLLCTLGWATSLPDVHILNIMGYDGESDGGTCHVHTAYCKPTLSEVYAVPLGSLMQLPAQVDNVSGSRIQAVVCSCRSHAEFIHTLHTEESRD
ncbi:hypothetical protein EDD16DRAFT_245857 [Pisolithus croceorrhizus]|nr:hypothetical protein EDD16DRAFT_245857 [Pisolithus croceorrhizus]